MKNLRFILKKALPAIVGFILLSCGRDFDGAIIDAKLSNAEGKLFLLEDVATPEKVVVDSARVKDSLLTMRVYVNEGIYRLRESESDKMVFLYISGQKEKIRLEWDTKENYPYAIAGNQPSRDIQKIIAYMEGKKRFGRRLDTLAQLGHQAEWLDSLNKRSNEEMIAFVKRMADSLPNADVAAFALNFLGVNKEEIVYLVEATRRLHEKDPKARYAKVWYEAMNGYRTAVLDKVQNGLVPGVKAPDFSLPDIYGDTLRLSQYKGKFVLLDFWASWCQPCRKENPNIVEAYRRFRTRNFTIVSISLDSKKEQWQKGIKADKLVWRNHASDLMKWRSPVLELYQVKAIPANFLIDTAGMIIAKDLYSEALLSYLDRILSQAMKPEVSPDSTKKDSLVLPKANPQKPVFQPSVSSTPPPPAPKPTNPQPVKPAEAPKTTEPSEPKEESERQASPF